MPTFRLKQDQTALLVVDIQERLCGLGPTPRPVWTNCCRTAGARPPPPHPTHPEST
ncbi:hypothetical protein [Myxococcus xanthus]|uniref:hypothetical protein n=1 Tax=Myxococcus xanthus TaxID=34 RepID=UPI001F1BB89D|nr:hypothetical protein [Myxococcus xanthus]